MALYKNQIPRGITAVVAVILIVEYFFNISGIKNIAGVITSWAVIIATIALGVGAVNLFLVHGRKTIQRSEQWYFSIWLLFVMCVTIVLGIAVSTSGLQYRWIYDNVYLTSYNAVWCLLTFSSISAAYRSFRARNIESAILFAVTILVFMKEAPIGGVIWSGFPVIGGWILDVPTMAAFRGIWIGIAIGAIILALRTILGLERGWLGGE
jgi:hypothetical protein